MIFLRHARTSQGYVGRSQSNPVDRLLQSIRQKTWRPQKETKAKTQTSPIIQTEPTPSENQHACSRPLLDWLTVELATYIPLPLCTLWESALCLGLSMFRPLSRKPYQKSIRRAQPISDAWDGICDRLRFWLVSDNPIQNRTNKNEI